MISGKVPRLGLLLGVLGIFFEQIPKGIWGNRQGGRGETSVCQDR